MMRHILYAIIAIVALYLCYDIYRLYTAQNDLYDVPENQMLNPENADLDVIEFLDYSCRYCREIHPTITQAILQDGHVRYIPRPLPSQDHNSLTSAMLVYAAGKQGKFIEMHNAIMENYRTISPNVIEDLTDSVGVDREQVSTDMADEDLKRKLIENGSLFGKIGGHATPMFVIGKDMIFIPKDNMPSVQDFIAMFQEARANR